MWESTQYRKKKILLLLLRLPHATIWEDRNFLRAGRLLHIIKSSIVELVTTNAHFNAVCNVVCDGRHSAPGHMSLERIYMRSQTLRDWEVAHKHNFHNNWSITRK